MIARLQARFLLAWRRLHFRLRRDRLAQELAEELEFHFEQRQAAHRGAGIESIQAAGLSRRQLGNVTLAQEECRDMWSFVGWDRLMQDLRHAIRMYGRTPVFTGICVLSIALGIGGNAAVLSLVNALLLRPLPYPEAERLVRIKGIYPRAAVPFFQAESRSLEVAAVSAGSEFNWTGQGEAGRLFGSRVSPNFLTVLGTPVAMGRGFQPGDESPGRDHLVLISHAVWKDRFAGDASVLGRIIRLDGVERQIVGIMPPGFSYPSSRVQLWIPMRIDPSNFLEYWGSEFMPLLARLRPGVSAAVAQSEVHALANRFRGLYPYPMPRDFNADSTAIPLQQDIVGDARGRLLILLCSVAAVLLIACANVASLLLSRATTRRRELALRVALGAGRLRVVRQLLTESTGLALVGAALGILFGISALSVFKSVLPASLPGLAQAEIDWPIVAAAAVLALGTGLVSGLTPAWSASQVDITTTIKTGSQRATSGFWSRLRGVLIAGEVALTLVLLVSAALLLRSVYGLYQSNPGFESSRILTVQISPDQSACMPREACVARYERLLQRAGNIAGVREAAVANSVPLDGRVPTIAVDIEGRPKTAENPAPMLWLEAVSPGYLRMMRIPLLAGRYMTDADSAGSTPVIVIPSSTARRFWPGGDAVGKHIRLAGSNSWRTIVGVVGDVHHFSLSRGLPDGVAGAVYMPYAQSDQGDGQVPASMTLLARVEGDQNLAINNLGQLARNEDPNVPVGRVQPLSDAVTGSIDDLRATMLVFVGFAATAIVLAAVGLYGLMSYWVSQRTYEIGLRVAIGCSRQGILSMILGQGMKLACFGVTAGIACALLMTRFLSSLLYGVTATDVTTFAFVAGLVLAVSALATALPAWRAARINPITALRAE